jgi:hypothetical protein
MSRPALLSWEDFHAAIDARIEPDGHRIWSREQIAAIGDALVREYVFCGEVTNLDLMPATRARCIREWLHNEPNPLWRR